MSLIDGRAIAAAIGRDVSARAAGLRTRAVVPTLAVVVPTSEAALWYVRSITRAAERTGIALLRHVVTAAEATAPEAASAG